MRIKTIHAEFVDEIPEDLDEGVLYVSKRFSVAAHLCCCGCESRITTSLKPTRWKLTYSGDSVSLSPSIGNWRLPCQSHYWIHSNQVEWAPQMSRMAIEKGRLLDRISKESHIWYNSNPPLGYRLKSQLKVALFHARWIWKRLKTNL